MEKPRTTLAKISRSGAVAPTAACAGSTPTSPPHEMSDLVAEFAVADGIPDVARQLLGGDVNLHQARINAMPGFTGRGRHSDFETWHAEDGLPDIRTVSCSAFYITPFPRSTVFLVFNSAENPPEAPFAASRPRPEYIAASRRRRPAPWRPRNSNVTTCPGDVSGIFRDLSEI